MKKVLAVLGFGVMTAVSQIVPAPWFLVWDDPNPPGSVSHYNVWKTDVTPPTFLGDTFTNRWQINLPPGAHTLAVSAVSPIGLESAMSTNATVNLLVAVIALRVEQ